MTNEDIKTVRLIVNSEQASKRLDEINRQLETARRKKLEAFEKGDAKGIQVYSKEIRKLEREQANMQTRAKTIEKTLLNLDKATPKELRRTIKEINRELNSGAIERGSEEWNTLQRSLKTCNAELKKIKDEGKAATNLFANSPIAEWGYNWVGFTTVISQARSALSSITESIGEYVEKYADMEERMADVRKYTGLSTETVRTLNEEFKKMDTRTSREQLNALAADAGRLGIQGKEAVMAFVQAADIINVALGEDLGENAVKNIGKLAQLFGDDDRMGLRGAMLATASTINDLGQTSSASESYIVDFTGRLAGAGVQAGMTQAEIMALGAVLDQSMVNAEEGSTALSKIIQKIYREPQKVAQAAGMDVAAFTKLVKEDANEALLQFATAVSKMGGMEKIAPMLGDMSLTGAGVSKTLMALAGNIDLVRQTQEQATQSFAAGTSATNEFNVANNTVQAQLEKSKKDMAELSQELGERLTPLYLSGVNVMKMFTSVLITLIRFIGENARSIISITTAIVAYTAAVNASVAADKLKVFWTNTLISSLKKLWLTISKNPYALLGAAIAYAISKIVEYHTATRALTLQQEKAAAAQNALADAQKQAANSTAEEKLRLNQLTAIIHDNTRSIDDRKSAIDKLRKIIPGYHGEISAEGRLVNDNAEAIDNYIRKIDKMAQAVAVYDKIKENARQQVEAELALKEQQDLLSQSRYNIENNPDLASRKKNGLSYSWRGGLQYGPKEQNELRIQAEKEREYIAMEITARENRLEVIKAEGEALRQYTKDKGIANQVEQITTGTDSSGTDTGNSGTVLSNEEPRKLEQQLKERNRARELAIEQTTANERLLLRARYDTGLIDYAAYQQELRALDISELEQKRDLWGTERNEYTQHNTNLLELKEKHAQEDAATSQKWSRQQIDTEQKAEEQAAKEKYLKGELSEKQYQERLNQIALNALFQRVQYEEMYGTPESVREARIAYEQESNAQMLARRERYMQQINDIQKKYLGASIEERKAEELKLVEELAGIAEWSQEEIEQIKAAIRKKYAEEQKKEVKEDIEEINGALAGAPVDEVTASLLALTEHMSTLRQKIDEGKAEWRDYAQVAVSSIAMVSAALNSAGQLVQANITLEEARIIARYDAEIEAAGENSEAIARIEATRDAKIRRMKNEALQRQVKIQIAQAVAQGAMAAINAYSSAAAIPIAGFILAPIAAATAIAATGIQIAAIRKQAKAQAIGYYEGGFTGGSDYHRDAGIVHEGEFVANHKAVNNPNIAPVLRLIDHAQRNNTVASLTAADVSRAVAAPQMTATGVQAAAANPVVLTESSVTRDTLRRLTDMLDAGIESYVILDGERGLDKKWNHYQNLKNRR